MDMDEGGRKKRMVDLAVAWQEAVRDMRGVEAFERP